MKSLFFTLLFLLTLGSLAKAQVSFPFSSTYSYLKGSEASTLPTDWYKPGYSIDTWTKGASPFYYEANINTPFSDMKGNYTTVYLKSTFTATKVIDIQKVEFKVDYDDGFVIWINGVEVLSRNAPATRSYKAVATTVHESGTVETISVPVANSALVEGTNSMAVQLFNASLTSSDLYFDLAVSAQPELPIYANDTGILFSRKAGFYTDPFTLYLSTAEVGASVVYTLDGSNPQTSATAIKATAPVMVAIDPASTKNRAATPAVLVRASLVADGFQPSFPQAHTFIFTPKVLTQRNPGGKWPVVNVNGQVIDLAMDPDVVNDARYKDQMESALLDIPTISVMTDLDNLFNASTGIYVNARQHGMEWERECSVELIDTKTDSGFQINAGLRIRGGNSRQPENRKHAFRLFFRQEYGAPKLEFPLFGDEGVGTFDKIDLRTEQNYSWSMDGDSHNTFLRDVFSRDLQGEMGQPYTRSRYYHLYLNGMYWGLYQTEERPEADFAENYLGGDDDDYDVVKVATENWPYVNEATDGNMNAWEELYTICKKSTLTLADYYGLEGKDANGNPKKGSKILVDIDNLIDYMLTIFYTGNIDAPVSAWFDNNMPNNYFALYNHNNRNKGFVFVGHDAEHSLFVDPIYVNDGLYENRVTINDPAMQAPTLEFFNPQWLHYKLTKVEEYKVRFADRANFYFSKNQALSEEKCAERWLKRKDQIDLAIIGESARWGDAKTATPLTRDDDWLPEVENVLNEFFPYRSKIVVEQLQQASLYSTLTSPVIKANNVEVTDMEYPYASGLTLTLSHANTAGEMYYTLNGTDPRVAGGTISSSAVQAANNQTLPITGTTVLMVRVKNGNLWSALRQITILNNTEDYSNLRLTEIHYHPADEINGRDTVKGKDLEFIELKNIGTTALNISGLVIDSAIYFQVPQGTVINPNGFYVVAAKPNTFYTRYGKNASGNYSGSLNNAGDYILITDALGHKIIDCTYDDSSPWPTEPDGDDYSLAAVEVVPTGNPNEPAYWKASARIFGSPFADDAAPSDVAENAFWEALLYPNPTNGVLNIQLNGVSGQSLTGKVQIINSLGQTVVDVDIANGETQLNLTHYGLPVGVYNVLINNTNQSVSEKLVLVP